MANAKIGSHPSHGGCFVEKLDSARQLASNDSGKVFMIDNTAAFTINLPKLSANIAGWSCKLIVQVDGSADVSVVGFGLPAAGGDDTVSNADNDLMVYRELDVVAGTGAYIQLCDGFTIEAAGVIGDSFEIFSDGTKWFASAWLSGVAGGTAIDS